MINGQIYDRESRWHPNLEFVGRIDPFLTGETLGSLYLIHPQYVITATHCLKETDKWNVVFPDMTQRKIELYCPIENHDIALCKLDEPITHIIPVSISSKPPEPRQYAIVTGWGRTQRDDDINALRWAGTRLIRPAKNNNVQIERGRKSPQAGKGDSGSPIIVNDNGKLYVSAMIRATRLSQKAIWPFHDFFIECPSENEMDYELFRSIVTLDYERRSYRETFTCSDLSEWRSLDEWISGRITSEEK